MRIIVDCGTPKSDCSIIELQPGGGDGDGDGTVEDPDQPSVDLPCVHVCENGITTLLAPYSDQNTYDWVITGGTLIGPLQDPAQSKSNGTAPGQGNISVTITGPGGVQVIQQCVEVGEAPHAEFTAPSPVCLNTPVQFQSLSTLGASHFWDFGDGETSNQINPSHSFLITGTHDVVLTLTTRLLNSEGDTVCCCQDTYALDIEVLDEEGPTIECITTLCEGDSACYWTDIDPADCPSGATFTWTVNDANGNAVSFDGQGTAEICLQWDQGPSESEPRRDRLSWRLRSGHHRPIPIISSSPSSPDPTSCVSVTSPCTPFRNGWTWSTTGPSRGAPSSAPTATRSASFGDPKGRERSM